MAAFVSAVKPLRLPGLALIVLEKAGERYERGNPIGQPTVERFGQLQRGIATVPSLAGKSWQKQ